MNPEYPLSHLPEIWNLIRNFSNPIKLVWIGLDNAGKSSLIKRLKTGEYMGQIPRTMGLTVDKLFYEADSHVEIVSWDLGGQVYFRENLWNDYLKGASAIIYVLDESDDDANRFAETKKELWEYVLDPKNKTTNIPILILANKCDKEHSSEEQLSKKLDLSSTKAKNLKLFHVSALNGQNLDKAFIWLFTVLLTQSKTQRKNSW